jgi:hypothetical protein
VFFFIVFCLGAAVFFLEALPAFVAIVSVVRLVDGRLEMM